MCGAEIVGTVRVSECRVLRWRIVVPGAESRAESGAEARNSLQGEHRCLPTLRAMFETDIYDAAGRCKAGEGRIQVRESAFDP